MDLISAKVEAAKQSRIQKKKMYINVDSEGECTVSGKPVEAITVFSNGSEVALDSDIKVSTAEVKTKNKKQTIMATPKTAAKKAAPAKKVAVKEERPANQIGKATTLFLTKTQWEKFAEKGNIRDNVQKAVIKQFGL